MTNSDRIKDALRLLCWRNKGDSQSAFARKVGLNQSYISGIISGKKTKRLPLETMEKLFPDLVVLPLGMDHGRPPVEKEIIKSTIHFSDIMAGDVMTPREKIVAIPLSASRDELKRILLDEKYSRFPVYDGDIDHIEGVLRSSAMLWKLMNDQPVDILDNITRPYIIRSDLPVSKVFEGMSGRHTHMAIVADNGVTRGVITMEDILEEIVGEIYDEDDVTVAPTAPRKGGAKA